MFVSSEPFAEARRLLEKEMRNTRRRKRVPQQVIEMREMLGSLDAMIEDGLDVTRFWLEDRTSLIDDEKVLPRTYNLYNANVGKPVSLAIVGDAANKLTNKSSVYEQYAGLAPLISLVRDGLVDAYSFVVEGWSAPTRKKDWEKDGVMPSQHPDRFSVALIGAVTPDRYVVRQYRLQDVNGGVGLGQVDKNITISPTELDRSVAFHMNSLFAMARWIDNFEREDATVH